MYFDDYCLRSDSTHEANEMVQQLPGLFGEGGWRMRKFVSNDSEVMESIAEKDRLPTKMVEFKENNHGFTKASGPLDLVDISIATNSVFKYQIH